MSDLFSDARPTRPRKATVEDLFDPRPLRVVSLFAGIGGFDLAFERCGMKVVAQVEIDENCRKLLANRFPGVRQFSDVREVGRHNLPKCDVICGGFPCQDLSVAGKRAGLDGKRSGLFFEMARIIDECGPEWVVWENVTGLSSSFSPIEPAPEPVEGGRWEVEEDGDLETVVRTFSEMRYFGACRIFDSQYLGVAQRRRRWFGVFTRLDLGEFRGSKILSIPEGLRGHPAPGREAGQGVAGCLESRTDGGGFPGTDGACAGHVVPCVSGTLRGGANGHRGYSDPADSIDTMIPAVAGCCAAKWAKGTGGPAGDEAQNLVPVAFHQNQRAEVTINDTAGSLNVGGGKPGQGYPAIAVPVAFTERTRKEGRTFEAQPDLALTNPGAGGRAHSRSLIQGMQVRRLTPTECERLQGFPDGWTEGFSDTVRYRMLGNAVTEFVVEWIGARLAREIRHGL